jgi:choline dehydrogenase-like flavoprotein
VVIDGIEGLGDARRPLVIAGAGPVGLALATELARRKVPVVLLESGGRSANRTVQQLSDAELTDPARHDDMSVAVARRLGGSSNLWGGRCLPYDAVDFEPRDWVDARWPIGVEAIRPYLPAAVAATRSGAPVYHTDEPLTPGSDPSFTADALERWVNVQAAQDVHGHAIRHDPLLEVRTHATLVGTHFADSGAVEAIEVADSRSGERVRVPVATLVIAGGGLETTRLLLAAQRDAPDRFGGPEGALGRYYMGHLIGEIADIVFRDDDATTAFDFTVDAHGSYVRRRIVPTMETQLRHRLLNSAFWPVVPPVADPRHHSAILSMVYLALSYQPFGNLVVAEAIRRRHVPQRPTERLRHLRNVAAGVPSAVAFAADFLRRRHARVRLPGFFAHNPSHRYGLSFHAEQAPSRDSRVWLSGRCDRLGVPSLAIDLRFSDADVASLLATHDLLEGWLGSTGLGRIEYRGPREERAAAVMKIAAHGTHQIGLARMGTNRREAVVDADCRTFDAPNLFLAGSAVLPTSSQANPTLTAVALALRLADHLATILR